MAGSRPAAAEDSDLSRLDPEPIKRTLSTGTEVEVVRLKTRQFFRLLKVLTHGAGNALLQQSLDFSAGGEEFASRLVGLVLISIPDAEQEAIDFIQSMVKPAGLPDKPASALSKAERERSEAAWAGLYTDLYNPELDDLVDLITDIVTTEAPHIQELGKRVASLVELATKTGQAKPEQPEQAPTPAELAEADSQPPSISSAASTDGETPRSSTSRSAGSSKSSPPSLSESALSLSAASG